jgi:hypothetical protein
MTLLDVPGLLLDDTAAKLVIFMPQAVSGLAWQIWNRRRGEQVQFGFTAVLGTALWVTADPDFAARLGLAPGSA